MESIRIKIVNKFQYLKPVLIVVVIGWIIFIAYRVALRKSLDVGNEYTIPEAATIYYDSQYNFRQSFNDCGPFNVAAVTRALTNKNISSVEFAKSIKWRLFNNYTLPIGLEKQLRENDIRVVIPSIASLADENKILFLKEQLSRENPVIILGKQGGYQHYLTLFGYSSPLDQFFVYDSMYKKGNLSLTDDGNNENPGNRNMTSKELLDFWRKGGVLGLYQWYAIIASLKEPHYSYK